MSRVLVSVRDIAELTPIAGADRIEVAQVLGWRTIVKKGEFKVGDKCVWFEIDSFLPAADQRYSFLEKTKRTWRGREGYRLKTMRMKGQLSQGLALPISLFPEVTAPTEKPLQDLLGVVLWEEDLPVELAGCAKGSFPQFLRKTDQERIQNIFVEIDKGAMYEKTVKMDGSSHTAYCYKGNIGVCSRNLELKLDEPANADNTYIKMARETGLLDALRSLNRNIAVQSEMCGPGLNANRAGLNEFGLYVFDIYDIDRGQYFTPMERRDLFDTIKMLAPALKHVPILSFGVCPELQSLDSALAAADMANPASPHTIAEGVVYKRADGLFSFKAISNAYLEKWGL